MDSTRKPNRSRAQQTHVLQARRRELGKVHASIRQGDEVRLLSRIRRETGIVRVAPLRRHNRNHAAFGHAFGPALKDIPIQRGQQPVHVLVFHGAYAPGHGIHQRVPRPQYGLDDTPPVCQLLSGQLVCRPLFSEVRDNLLHDQRTALCIGAGINPILVGDGRDFRIAHAPPQPVEHTPLLVLSQKPVQAVVHHVLVHPHFRRACCTAQIVRYEVHRAGSGIVHPLQTRRHLAVKLPDMLGKFLKRLDHPRIGGVGRPFSERVRDGLHRRLAHAEARGRHLVQEFAGFDGSHRRFFFGIRLLGRFRQLLLDLEHPLTGILELLLLLKRTFQLFLKRRYLGLGAFDLRRVLGGASRVPGQIVLEAREQARSPVEGAGLLDAMRPGKLIGHGHALGKLPARLGNMRKNGNLRRYPVAKLHSHSCGVITRVLHLPLGIFPDPGKHLLDTLQFAVQPSRYVLGKFLPALNFAVREVLIDECGNGFRAFRPPFKEFKTALRAPQVVPQGSETGLIGRVQRLKPADLHL